MQIVKDGKIYKHVKTTGNRYELQEIEDVAKSSNTASSPKTAKNVPFPSPKLTKMDLSSIPLPIHKTNYVSPPMAAKEDPITPPIAAKIPLRNHKVENVSPPEAIKEEDPISPLKATKKGPIVKYYA